MLDWIWGIVSSILGIIAVVGISVLVIPALGGALIGWVSDSYDRAEVMKKIGIILILPALFGVYFFWDVIFVFLIFSVPSVIGIFLVVALFRYIKENSEKSSKKKKMLDDLLIQKIRGCASVEEIETLIKQGAELKNDIGGINGLLRYYAQQTSGITVLKLLLDHGADIEAKNNEGETALHSAVVDSQKEIVQFLLKQGANIDAKTNDGINSLMGAVASGYKEIVQLLLEHKADIEAKANEGWTPLSLAVAGGHKEIVQLLLEHGADIEAKDNAGLTVLVDAVVNEKKAEIVQLLLEHGAATEAKDKEEGWTPLMFAAAGGHKEIVQLLLKHGAATEAKDNEGWTSLICAVTQGQKEVVQLLLDHGADIEARINEDGSTSLMNAASQGHKEIVQLLLERKADIEAKDNDGWTSLKYATKEGHKEIVQLLLEHGAGTEAKDNKEGWTPLMNAANQGYKECVQLLLEHKADIEAKDNEGWAPLFIAANQGHKECVQLLLEHKADIEAKDNEGWTPLMTASNKGHKECVQLLLKHGADTEAKDNKEEWTALKNAANKGHKAIVQLLLEHEAILDINDTTTVGHVISVLFGEKYNNLLKAAENGHKEIVELLLKHGADVEAKDNEGWTPLMLAANEGHKEVVQLLLKHGAKTETASNWGWTPLLVAATDYDHKEIVQLLLAHGADIEAKNNEGSTPLIAAAENGHDVIVQLLLEHGADIEAKNNEGSTPLLVATFDYFHWVVQLLLEHGADIEAKNHKGSTALMNAASHGHKESVQLLLEHGAILDINDTTTVGNVISVLFGEKYNNILDAAENGHQEIVQLLLGHGADTEIANNEGWTPLMHAAYNGHKEVLQLLLKHGANIEVSTTTGWTPLMISALEGYKEIAQLLLKHGANTEAKNNKGRTPLLVAAENGHKEIVQLLLEYKADIEAKDNTGSTALILAVENKDIAISTLLIEHNAIVELDTEITSSVHGMSMTLDSIVSKKKNKIFKTTVDKINLNDTNEPIQLTINDIDKDVEITDIGVKIEYTPNQNKYIDWQQKSNILNKILKTNRIELFDNLNGKYGIYFFNHSVEANLLLELTIAHQKPHLVNFLEIHHSKVFLFKNINGVSLQSWQKEKQLIEDILGVPVSINYYDKTHNLYDPKISTDKLIIIQEEAISILPKKLNLHGSFLKFQEENGYEKYYFEYISKEAYDQWEESISEINAYLGSKFEISEYNEISGILVIVNAIEVRLPNLLGVHDDSGNTPQMVYSKEMDGNRYFYYSYVPTIRFSAWEAKIKLNSLSTLFNKPTAVYNLIDCDSTHPDYDNKLLALGHEQTVLVKELTPVPSVSFITEANFLADQKIYWGSGAGGLDYYTSMHDTMHTMAIGGTGSGKSTLMNGVILSLIHNINHIGKLYLVDLKSGVEFNKYNKLDSEKITVFSRGTKPSKLLAALREVEAQMYLRLEYMREVEVEQLKDEPIFIVIDEFAQIELMPVEDNDERLAFNEIRNTLLKLGSLSRAANIKLFVQTQDPSKVPEELKKHLISRILLKTSNSLDARQTLQNHEELNVLGLNHVKFGKGRFVFEDNNDGEIKLTELQFPLIVQGDGEGEIVKDSNNSVIANLDYFMRYKNLVSSDPSNLDQKMQMYHERIRKDFPHLNETKTLSSTKLEEDIGEMENYEDEMDKKDDNASYDVGKMIENRADKIASELGLDLNNIPDGYGF